MRKGHAALAQSRVALALLWPQVVELSACGELLQAGMSYPMARQLFEAHLISPGVWKEKVRAGWAAPYGGRAMALPAATRWVVCVCVRMCVLCALCVACVKTCVYLCVVRCVHVRTPPFSVAVSRAAVAASVGWLAGWLEPSPVQLSAHVVSVLRFSTQGAQLMASPLLAVRVGEVVYPWATAAPYALGLLLYGQHWPHLVPAGTPCWAPSLLLPSQKVRQGQGCVPPGGARAQCVYVFVCVCMSTRAGSNAACGMCVRARVCVWSVWVHRSAHAGCCAICGVWGAAGRAHMYKMRTWGGGVRM